LDGRHLPAELEELRELLARVESECAIEAMTLSWSVMEISDALVDLVMFPIRDIPEHPQLARDVLTAVGPILECLWEERDSGAGP
jgi:hypothetical protein